MSSDYSEITSEGMVESPIGWIKVQTTVLPYRETEKAYYAMIQVDEMLPGGDSELLYGPPTKSWIPKSMAENVWWICVNKFDETRKVSNRVFEEKTNQHESNDYNPHTVREEEEG